MRRRLCQPPLVSGQLPVRRQASVVQLPPTGHLRNQGLRRKALQAKPTTNKLHMPHRLGSHYMPVLSKVENSRPGWRARGIPSLRRTFFSLVPPSHLICHGHWSRTHYTVWFGMCQFGVPKSLPPKKVFLPLEINLHMILSDSE